MSNSEIEKKQKAEKVQKALSIVKIAVLLFIIVGIPLIIYVNNPDVIHLFTDRNAMNDFLSAHQGKGIIIFVGIQIFQVVVSVIPGQIIQMAAGFVFGGLKAYLFAIGGVFVGTFIAFNLSKYLGKDAIMLIFKEKNVTKFIDMMSSKKAYVAIILIYLIPGLPKDVFTYAAGLSNFKALPFVITSVIARSPAMIGSLAFGAMFRDQNYVGMVILCVAVGILLIVAFIKRKALFALLENVPTAEAGHSSKKHDTEGTVGLKVDFLWYPIGTSDFVHAFFSTICFNLENKVWGSRFPRLMKDLYQGELSYENIDEAKEELKIIQEELKAYTLDKVVWDLECLEKQPPWGDEISPEITDLSNYFVTCDGLDIFDELFKALQESQVEKQNIILGSL